MTDSPSLKVEECWAAGGRLRLEVRPDGRVRLAGNHEGLVGLARVLLWRAQVRAEPDSVLDLATFAEFEEGPTLEITGPA